MLLSEIIKNLQFGLLIFDRYKGSEHFRILPVYLEEGTLEAYISDNKIYKRFWSGIFLGAEIDLIAEKGILIAYKLKKELGKADGMSTMPLGMNKRTWERIKMNRNYGSSNDNYLITLDKLKKILEIVNENEEGKYLTDFKKRKMLNKTVENKLSMLIMENYLEGQTETASQENSDVSTKQYNLEKTDTISQIHDDIVTKQHDLEITGTISQENIDVDTKQQDLEITGTISQENIDVDTKQQDLENIDQKIEKMDYKDPSEQFQAFIEKLKKFNLRWKEQEVK
ncbi:MAG: hypothetical protein ACFFD1_16265 [Candidatus Thorarchaeota archaeon]